uniref:Putative paraflagellar rod protein n=1 Tax=Trypanosoma congolense (strain IL3000) TaxID=1068625 RepID=G0UQT7_TRYCI|nr:putative paraflagellar rod protein [Trypanosoma congolense IL3000]
MSKSVGDRGGRAPNGDAIPSTSSSAQLPAFTSCVAATRKAFLQREAVLNACAISGNNVGLVQLRRNTLHENSTRILKLFEDMTHTQSPTTSASTAATAARKEGAATVEQLNIISTLAEACAEAFRKECSLELGPRDMILPEEVATNNMASGANGAGAPSSATPQESVKRRIAPLQKVFTSVKELRNVPLYNKLLSASQRGSLGAMCMTSLVKNLTETLEESLQSLEQGYGTCPYSARDIAEWAGWVQPLVRLTNECMQVAPLERVIEGPRERLRRVAFDVEEKQREQEDAVTDGDMVRSEQLYFEKTALLESMKPLYDELEAAIEEAKQASVDEPMRELQTLLKELSTKCAPKVLDHERQMQRRGKVDLERLQAHRQAIVNTRNAQVSSYKVYVTEWEKLFRHNEQQQENCLRALEELEQRIRYLEEERAFLVEDRLEVAAQEQQLADDAASFMLFASQHEQKLCTTIDNLDQSLSSGGRVLDAVRGAYNDLSKYIKDVVSREVEEKLLEIRKERLAHFRGLYLTLGELKYKKERHLEELEKRIDYYHVQQELAMDTFNPKAKEFSKAKKDLLEVKETMQQQIDLIGQKAVKQLEDFKPTERLLLSSGVNFVHPVKELEEMNSRRTQKLLEYHNLMSTMGGEQQPNAGTVGDGGNKVAEVAL